MKKAGGLLFLLALLLVLFPVFFSSPASAASPAVWIRQFGGDSDESGRGTAVDSAGNIYLAGYINGRLPGQISARGNDAFVRKYSSTGTEIWSRQFGSTGNDYATGIAADSQGNTFISGYTTGSLSGQNNAGKSDAFVAKLNSDGVLQWTQQFGAGDNDTATAVAVDSSGRAYIAGYSYNNGYEAFIRQYNSDGTPGWEARFDNSPNGWAQANGIFIDNTDSIYIVGETYNYQDSAMASQAYVRKYDGSGAPLWTRTFGTDEPDTGSAMAVDNSGNIFVVGHTYGTFPGNTYQGGVGPDVFISKMDSSGNIQWTRQFGTTETDVAVGTAVDSLGNAYVGGTTHGDLTMVSGNVDAYLRKYTTDGDELWTRQFEDTAFVFCYAVTIDSSDNIGMAGDVWESHLQGQTFSGGRDVFVRRYDSSGTELWTRQFGGSGIFDDARSIATDSSGNGFIAGITEGNLSGGSYGYADTCVFKYSAAGFVQWWGQYYSLDGAIDEAQSIALDSQGFAYVAGYTHGEFASQNSAGSTDAFIYKFNPPAGGYPVWVHQFGTASDDYALGVAVDASANVYVVGKTSYVLPGESSSGGTDAFIRKYDTDGNELWTVQFGSSGYDCAISVAVDSLGNAYVAGDTLGAFAGCASSGGRDAFLGKFDTSGNLVWMRQFGSDAEDTAMSVAVDNSGNAYLAGYATAALDGLTALGERDAFAGKYDSEGTLIWMRQFGTSQTDIASGIAVDGEGNVNVAGSTYGTLPGMENMGAEDSFLLRYDTDGNEISIRQFGTSGNDRARDVSVDGAGNAYIVGYTDGTFPGQTSGDGGDGFIAKFAVNLPPVAHSQTVNAVEDIPQEITLTADDADGDALTYSIVSQPSHGTLSGTAPNLIYLSAENYSGPDSFTFKASDGRADSQTATISITVKPGNDLPVANDQVLETDEDTPLAIILTASDIDSTSLSYYIVTPPAHGYVSAGYGANRTYTPSYNYSGPDSFTFRAHDGWGYSNTATVTIMVNPVSDNPVAYNQEVYSCEDFAMPITLMGYDGDGEDITYSIVTPPAHGTLEGNAPDVTYIPAANYFGIDTFKFKVNDGQADSNTATVTIDIYPVNDPPEASDLEVSTIRDTARSITLSAADVDGDTLTYSITAPPVNGSLTGIAPDLTYTPNSGFYGEDSFTFTASDGQEESNTATVIITVLPLPEIAVSPLTYSFGDVKQGLSSTTYINIANNGGAVLNIEGISFSAGSSPCFSISPVTLPQSVQPNTSLDVEVIFSPSSTGPASASLLITSNDPGQSTVTVALTGNGIPVENPPSQQISDILTFFESSVTEGSLEGSGNGNSADGRLNALRNMIEAAGDLIEQGDYQQALQQLQDAYNRVDGQPKPPDFASGPAAAELADRIQQLIDSLNS